MRPDASWKTWESHEPSRYVEGQPAADRQPQDTPPPLVELAFEGNGDEEIERLVTIAADV